MLPFFTLTFATIGIIGSIELCLLALRTKLKTSQIVRARSWQSTDTYLSLKTSHQMVFDEVVRTLNRAEHKAMRADGYKLTLRLLAGILPLLSTVAETTVSQSLLAIGASMASLFLLVFGSVAMSDSQRNISHIISKNILNYFAGSSGYDGNISDATRFKILVRSVNTALDSNIVGSVPDAGQQQKRPEAQAQDYTVSDFVQDARPVAPNFSVNTRPIDREMDDMETLSGQALIDASPFPDISQ